MNRSLFSMPAAGLFLFVTASSSAAQPAAPASAPLAATLTTTATRAPEAPTIDGDVLYELHSGRLLTRTGDRQIERVPGTFWTVRHAEQQALETLDDSVVLRTVMRH